jgi:hypothetical protein
MDMNTLVLESNNSEHLEKLISESPVNESFKPELNPMSQFLITFLETPEYKIEDKIIQIFKYDSLYSLEDKILITQYIIQNHSKISKHNDFYEEECHLVLINWIYGLKKEIQVNGLVDVRIYHLLYNILNIFESFPIDLKDLFNLNIYEKLNKIRKIMKKININIFCKLERLLNYWKDFSNDNMLNKKRLREYEQEYIDKLIESERFVVKVSILNNLIFNIFILNFINFLGSEN